MLWRAEHGLQTHFDDELSQILQPALAAYEMDRATGVTFGNQDFQAAVKNKVSKGETFKAYPTCFGHTDALAITSALKLTHVVKEIVTSRAEPRASSITPEATRIGLRVRIFAYPEGRVPVVMAAAAQHLQVIKSWKWRQEQGGEKTFTDNKSIALVNIL